MANFGKKVMDAAGGLNGLFIIGFLGIIWLMIYGNLSGNLGFASGTSGYNNTEAVISNLTTGAGNFYNFTPTIFLIMGVILLILVLLAILAVIVRLFKGKSGGFSSSA